VGADWEIVGGSGNRKLRKARCDGWTKDSRAAFLDHLAATGHVTRSVAAAGRSISGAYHLKRRDPVFSQLWDEALAAGCQRLEEALLARAVGGVNAIEPGAAIVAIDPAAIDVDLALKVLTRRQTVAAARERGGQGPRVGRISRAELIAAIDRRLAALARRQARLPGRSEA